MKLGQKIPHVDNDVVRVTEWRLKPGETTGHHRHDYDCVVVPLTSGTLRLVAADGESAVELTPGTSYFRSAGVAHEAINGGAAALAFVDVEMKDRPG